MFHLRYLDVNKSDVPCLIFALSLYHLPYFTFTASSLCKHSKETEHLLDNILQ